MTSLAVARPCAKISWDEKFSSLIPIRIQNWLRDNNFKNWIAKKNQPYKERYHIVSFMLTIFQSRKQICINNPHILMGELVMELFERKAITLPDMIRKCTPGFGFDNKNIKEFNLKHLNVDGPAVVKSIHQKFFISEKLRLFLGNHSDCLLGDFMLHEPTHTYTEIIANVRAILQAKSHDYYENVDGEFDNEIIYAKDTPLQDIIQEEIITFQQLSILISRHLHTENNILCLPKYCYWEATQKYRFEHYLKEKVPRYKPARLESEKFISCPNQPMVSLEFMPGVDNPINVARPNPVIIFENW